MSKKIGPLWRHSRALSFSLREDKKEFSKGKKRTTLPGIHGMKRKRETVYGLQNKEKRKFCLLYGYRDKQLYNLIKKVKIKIKKNEDITNIILLKAESRIDNLLFRSGIMITRKLSRLWVSQGHFLVNNKKVKSPSCQLKVGDVITFKKENISKNNLIIDALKKNKLNDIPSYLEVDKDKLTVKYLGQDSLNLFKSEINTSLIIEWYNRKM